MPEDYPVCKNTRYHHLAHPYYARKYDGYCLECSNAGIDDADAEIASFRAEAKMLQDAITQDQGLPVRGQES